MTVMSTVTLINNEVSMIHDKTKPPTYTSSKSCMRIHYLVFAYCAGQLITGLLFVYIYHYYQLNEMPTVTR